MEKEKTFFHREQGKKWILPKKVHFEGAPQRALKSYKILGYRFPKKGEYFLSGAICEAYLSPNDLSAYYLVVQPCEIEEVKTKTFDYGLYEQDMRKEFRKHYPSWNHIKDEEMDIFDDGNIYVGSTQFKTDIKLTDIKYYLK